MTTEYTVDWVQFVLGDRPEAYLLEGGEDFYLVVSIEDFPEWQDYSFVSISFRRADTHPSEELDLAAHRILKMARTKQCSASFEYDWRGLPSKAVYLSKLEGVSSFDRLSRWNSDHDGYSTMRILSARSYLHEREIRP